MNRLLIIICCICAINASPVPNPKRIGRLRIFNGDQIEIKDVPSQVSIIKLTQHGGREIFGYHSCGGTILSKNLVLTSGHCVAVDSKDLIVSSGSTSWNRGGRLHKVVKIIRHEDYEEHRFGRMSNDIAIMKVEPEFKVDGVRENFTKLAEKYDKVNHDDDAYLSGWGLNEENVLPFGLQGLPLKIVDLKECSKLYESLGNMTKYNICAQHPTGLRDMCYGDSGGPLFVNNKQVGIVSWSGSGCAVPGQPGIYTDVARYREWIDQHMYI